MIMIKVKQIFYSRKKSHPYFVKEEEFNNARNGKHYLGYWTKRVNMYTLNGKWNHVAHVNTLEIIEYAK